MSVPLMAGKWEEKTHEGVIGNFIMLFDKIRRELNKIRVMIRTETGKAQAGND